VKKEIDISIFNNDKSEIYAIELKYPRNGQLPEQMFSFCKDIRFLEQLCRGGMDGAWFVAVVDDRLYYEGKSEGIYTHFRSSKPISGRIEKPTGRDRSYLEIEGSYSVTWLPINDPMRGLVIPLNLDTTTPISRDNLNAERHTQTPAEEVITASGSSPDDGDCEGDPEIAFSLTLRDTYYNKGFFNVPVKFSRYVKRANGPVKLVLGTTGKRIQGRVDHNANPNTDNVRIFGGRELEHWFKLHFKPLDSVSVDLSSFSEIKLSKPGGQSRWPPTPTPS